ncbi:MAG: o-succinylbenzoate--CoA ligase [Vibrio sp.]
MTADLIQKWCETKPQAIALVTPQQNYTWQQLDQHLDGVAKQLVSNGVQAGSIIALISKNEVEAVLLYLASLRIGALCALMPPQPLPAVQQKLSIIEADFVWLSAQIDALDTQQLGVSVLELADAKSVSQEQLSLQERSSLQVQAFSHVFHPEQHASIVFTSGSTGVPKAVVHCAKHHLASAQGLTEHFKFEAVDSWLLSLPMYHVSGLSIIWRWLEKGAQMVIGTGDLFSDVQSVSYITHASLVPIQLQRLLDSQQPLTLKRVLLGGSHIPLALTERAKQQGIECWLGYGMTETASTVIAKQADGSPTAGFILPKRKFKLQGERIFVAGETLAAGYLSQGQLMALVTAENPWFDTKDLGKSHVFEDKSDEFEILGRADNQFISGGENIHCEEIEAVLVRHPDIKQAFVIPVEDEKYGHRPIAFVDAHSNLDHDSYQAFLVQHLDKFKCPDVYYVLPESLMNTGIKISRADLKTHYAQNHQNS